MQWPVDQVGAWHLPEDVTEDYCKQLLAEVMVRGAGGKPVWIEKSRENHFLDAEAMAAAAGYMLNVQHIKLGARRRPAEQSPVTAKQASSPKAPRKSARFREAARNLNN